MHAMQMISNPHLINSDHSEDGNRLLSGKYIKAAMSLDQMRYFRLLLRNSNNKDNKFYIKLLLWVKDLLKR